RLFEHNLEYRREIAGRGVDDVKDLGGRCLLCHRFIALSGNRRYSRQRVVALDGALYQLRFKLGDGSRRLNLRCFGLRSHLCACQLSFSLSYAKSSKAGRRAISVWHPTPWWCRTATLDRPRRLRMAPRMAGTGASRPLSCVLPNVS